MRVLDNFTLAIPTTTDNTFTDIQLSIPESSHQVLNADIMFQFSLFTDSYVTNLNCILEQVFLSNFKEAFQEQISQINTLKMTLNKLIKNRLSSPVQTEKQTQAQNPTPITCKKSVQTTEIKSVSFEADHNTFNSPDSPDSPKLHTNNLFGQKAIDNFKLRTNFKSIVFPVEIFAIANSYNSAVVSPQLMFCGGKEQIPADCIKGLQKSQMTQFELNIVYSLVSYLMCQRPQAVLKGQAEVLSLHCIQKKQMPGCVLLSARYGQNHALEVVSTVGVPVLFDRPVLPQDAVFKPMGREVLIRFDNSRVREAVNEIVSRFREQ